VEIAHYARDIILVIGTEGQILDANPSAQRAYGFSLEELQAMHIRDLRAPDTVGEIETQMRHAAAEGVLFETRHRRRSGEVFPCEVSSQAANLDGREVLVSVIRDLSELHAADARFRLLIDESPDGVLIHRQLSIIYANKALVAMLGYDSADQLIGRLATDIVATQYRDDVKRRIERLSSGEVPSVAQRVHYLYKRGEREVLTVEVWARLIEFQGAPANMATIHDVTERARLEEQLHQAQKMEAVGRLAGGVAHDFNNILTAIQGQGELLASSLPAGSPERHHLSQMLRAAERGANLTRQLLAFSRKQVLQPRLLDLNHVVSGLLPMLQRLIGEDIQLVTTLEPNLPAIRADAGQLEQVIVNLAVNARDAMPGGGQLTISTLGSTLGGTLDGDGGVILEVRDSGVGMDEATRTHLFEPFFTTKPRGKGTGLGLATVYGIITQSRGRVSVESAPGQGSTFRVWLPGVEGIPEATAPAAPLPVERGTEKVLVVEDDVEVRRFLQEVLQLQGYQVLTAHDGEQALAMAQDGGVRLVISDVIMPRMSGVELADRLRAQLSPPPRVLFITGYPGEALLEQREPLLMKPFSVGELARRVRQVLDA
jgi:two-component system cell cycle sensor histidine kinase/response regulator CckA